MIAATLVVAVVAGPRLRAEQRPIDAERSTLTVFVYKSGLFSAFADNHVIKASIARGSLSDGPSPGVELSVHAADLMVMDRDLSPERKAEVQARMVGTDVLDVARFPEITFASTSVQPAGPDRWTVTGRLAIHGQTRIITFPVNRVGHIYGGEVVIRQRDFGIEPIRIAGGTVKVKDELKVTFEIAGAEPTAQRR